MVINLTFKVTGSTEFSIAVEPEITVIDLKKKCAEHADIPVDAQRLIFKGKILKDKETLAFYNITDGSILHLVRRAAPAPEPANETANKPANTNIQTAPLTGNIANDNTPNMLLQMLMQSNGAGGLNHFGDGTNTGSGLNVGSFGDFMDAAGTGPSREVYQSILSSPLARTLMNELTANPEMLSNLINSNELLRNTVSQHPLMQQFFENPNLLREVLNSDVMNAGLRFENVFNMNNNGSSAANAGANNGFNAGADNPLSNAGAMAGLRFDEILNSFGNLAALRANNNNNNGASSNNNNSNPSTTTDGGNTGGVSNMPSTNNFGTQPRAPNVGPSLQQQDMYALFEQFLANNPNLGNYAMNNLNMGNMGAGLNSSPPVDTRPLEEIYESQLKSLQEMGFIDIAANIQALQETGGDINSAVTRLLERGYN